MFAVFHDAPVAIKLLFAFLENDLLIDLRVDSLHRRQTLPSVALLNANVNVVILHAIRGLFPFLSRRFVSGFLSV